MLEAIRKRSGGIVVKVLLLFLILSFGAWGIGDYLGDGIGGQNVASVGEVDISPQAFNNEIQREMNRLRSFLGDSLDADMAREIGLPDQVLNRMVRSALYLEAANRQGMIIDDAQVSAEIRSIPAFTGITGQFDKDAFRAAIANSGFSEQSFVRLVRNDLKRSTLIDSFGSGASGSKTMADILHGYRNETRSIELAVIKDELFSDIQAPIEADITAYHNDHQDQFMAPEYRSLSYIVLSASDIADPSSVGEEEIIEAYEMRKAEFISQGRRQVLQAIYADQTTATTALNMIAKGRDFSETANELAGISAESLDLGWVTRNDLLGKELADAVFETPTGSVSQAAQSMLGWHVFKVLGTQEEAVQALDEVRSGLADDVALEKAIDVLYEQANALEDELGSGSTLEDAARNLGLALRKMESVDRNGLNRAGTMVDLPADSFVPTAFSTDESSDSALMETNNNAYFILRVDGVDEPALRPLDTVRPAVAGAIMQARRAEQARTTAEHIVEGLSASSSLSGAVDGLGEGSSVVAVNSFKRDGTGMPAAMTRELASVMFEKTIGQGGMARASDGYVIGHLLSIDKSQQGSDFAAVEEIRSEISRAVQSDLNDQFARALEQNISVSINDNVMRQAF